MSDTATQLKEIQARIKKLQISRDQVNREAAVEENKLKEAYARLKELGIGNAETLSSKELQTMAEQLEVELANELKEVVVQLEEGERLVTKYEAMKEV